jgi:restriction system protein
MTPYPTPMIPKIDWIPVYKTIFIDLMKFWQLWLLIGVMILVRIAYYFYEYQRLSKAGIFEIDKMTGTEFEQRIGVLLRNLGYKVEHTGRTGDYGVDLVIEKDGRRIAVQTKCYKSHVGEDAVREAYAGKNMYHCYEAWVITNSSFTRMARKLAYRDYVKLWNRKYLVKALLTEKALKQ